MRVGVAEEEDARRYALAIIDTHTVLGLGDFLSVTKWYGTGIIPLLIYFGSGLIRDYLYKSNTAYR